MCVCVCVCNTHKAASIAVLAVTTVIGLFWYGTHDLWALILSSKETKTLHLRKKQKKKREKKHIYTLKLSE